MTRVTYNSVIVPSTHSKPTELFTIFLLFFFNFVFYCVECRAGLVSCSISFFIYFFADGVWSTPTVDDVRVWLTSFGNLGRAHATSLDNGYARAFVIYTLYEPLIVSGYYILLPFHVRRTWDKFRKIPNISPLRPNRYSSAQNVLPKTQITEILDGEGQRNSSSNIGWTLDGARYHFSSSKCNE